MIQAVVSKYGIVPKSAYPEATGGCRSVHMRRVMNVKMREFCKDLREAVARGATRKELDAMKKDMMAIIYRILATHLGEPPKKFDWEYVNTKKVSRRSSKCSAIPGPSRLASTWCCNQMSELRLLLQYHALFRTWLCLEHVAFLPQAPASGPDYQAQAFDSTFPPIPWVHCSQEYHEVRGITPKEFAEKHAGMSNVKNFVSLVNDPRNK